MSIAEQIMMGTQQQEKSFSVLSQNLSRLGQQVGQQLAMREYQKQAAEALPAMQAAYKSAMDDVTAGSVTQGYKKFMDAQFQFGTSQNPFIAQANEAAGTIFQNATTMYEKQQQRKAQYGGGLSPSRMPTDEEMLSDDFGMTDTSVEGDGMGGGDIRVPTGKTAAKSMPGMEAKFVSPDDANYDELMAMQQGEAPAGQPQEIIALRQPGQLDFSLNKYIPTQQIIERTRQSFDKYSSSSEDERKDFISAIPEVGEAPEEGDEMEIYGVGIGKVIGPKVSPEPEELEVTGKEVGVRGGKPFKTIKQERKKKPESQTKQEEAEQKTYEGWRENYSKAKLMFERNSQLRSLLEKAGGDITRLDYDIETVTNDANEQLQVANIKMEDQVIGQLETTAPEGMMSEFTAYQTITGAPSLFGKGSKWKFYKTEGKEKPSPAQPAAAGGLPAVQAQAPAPSAPEIPEEAAGLQQIVTQGQAAKAGEQAKVTEKRIKDIDAEIKRLSSPYIQGTRREGGMTIAGYAAPVSSRSRSKTADEAESDIKKITKLKSEKDALLGKKPLTQQEIKNGAIVEQGGKKYRFTNGKYIPID